MNFKDIHIGQLIAVKVEEQKMPENRILNFLNLDCIEDLEAIYKSKIISTDLLLKFCKLLNYDFFRIYSHHLILYKPIDKTRNKDKSLQKHQLPTFKKQLYTKEIIDFILELIKTNKKTKAEIIKEYKIPKTTLYRWINKYV